jgi:DNA-binding GntR family transcriptional regulator
MSTIAADRRPKGGRAGDSEVALRTQLAVDGIRDMIVRRRLFPGQQIRQEELATILGMSKSPVREALRALEMDGLVYHLPNQGYFTARFSAFELRQAYMMRTALETMIFRALSDFPAGEIEALHQLNGAIDAAHTSGKVHEMIQLNRDFHFRIFQRSGLKLVVREVERLWQICDSYRALYQYESFGSPAGRIVVQHGEMIEALASQDLDRLINVADERRESDERRVLTMLAE